VLYNLRGPCDERNLYAVTPSSGGELGGGLTGAIVVQQIWGDTFYHWIIECLTRLAAFPPRILRDAGVGVLVPALNEWTLFTLQLLGIPPARLRPLSHSTYYFARDVYLPAAGVCGLGPPTLLLRRMNQRLHATLVRSSGRYSVHLLYWYTSTNTDAAASASWRRLLGSGSGGVCWCRGSAGAGARSRTIKRCSMLSDSFLSRVAAPGPSFPPSPLEEEEEEVEEEEGKRVCKRVCKRWRR
jgi:hypothetical protein